MPLWLCGTPAIASAIEELSRERAALMQAALVPKSVIGARDGASDASALSR